MTWLVTWEFEDSKWGYWWLAVKDNPEAAESLGVVVFHSKMAAAGVSAIFTSIAGSFYAQFVGYIDPESVMNFQISLLMALPAVLGGIGTLWGPALGAVILIPLNELVRSYVGGTGAGIDLIIYGLLILVISLARPQGLVSLLTRRGLPGRYRMTTPPLLEVQHLSRRFGGLVANADVSMCVAQGEIVGLIGPNGAGKSTLFNLIAGSLPSSQGTVGFDGADVTALPPPARCAIGIARTFQVVRSFESMSVIDNVIVGALVRTRSTDDARRNARKVLSFTKLDHRVEAPASQLTPAEKRRLEIARALATGPKLLLLDEVMTGLTPGEARKGVDLVRRIRDTGVTVLMVEHVMEIVLPLVDRVVVLDLGRVLAQGKPAEIARDPKVIGAYLESVVVMQVRDLTTTYKGLIAISDVSLDVASGEIVCVAGANGAGKSTLLKSIAGLVPARSGTIVFSGERIEGLAAHLITARGIAFVPENRRLFPRLSVRDNLRLGSYLLSEERGSRGAVGARVPTVPAPGRTARPAG